MKKILFFTLATSLLLASCGQQETSNESAQTSTPVAQEETVAESPTVLAANFEVYNEGSLWEAENTVLFFHQESCGTCKTTEANLIDSGVPADTKVLKVDFDTEFDLRQKYWVTMKHTFVQVDADGNMIKKWNGSMDLADIQEQLNASDDKMMKEDDKMMKEDDKMMEKEGEAMMEKDWEVMEDKTEAKTEEVAAPTGSLAGTYASYDASMVGKTDKTVLFFHAAWCPSCVSADKSISAGEVPEGLTILKTDFDSSTDLRQKYWVTSQHTFVQVDAEGNLINKWSGGNSIDDIIERL